ncbi:hypothetical protein [Alteromonas gracilis]|uniref:hypothetical protein n=1 Tax=Alteromonas gracilis TaxID=1479524 RepID=UPI003735AC16
MNKKPFFDSFWKYSVLIGLALLLIAAIKVLFGGQLNDVSLLTLAKGFLLLLLSSVVIGFFCALWEKHGES